ncbi:hypothetical protein [Spiroplasma sp. Moj]
MNITDKWRKRKLPKNVGCCGWRFCGKRRRRTEKTKELKIW